MSDATIGSALTKRREQLSMSRVKAAQTVGMSRTTYSSYERDEQRPSVDVFPALAAFLEVSIEDFLILYGATVIAGLRPSLEKVLLEHLNPAIDHSESTHGHSDDEDTDDHSDDVDDREHSDDVDTHERSDDVNSHEHSDDVNNVVDEDYWLGPAPSIPAFRETPPTPEVPSTPEGPDIPPVPDPGIPEVPDTPPTSAIPEVPNEPAVPGQPPLLDVPEFPSEPRPIPDAPNESDAPNEPPAPDVPPIAATAPALRDVSSEAASSDRFPLAHALEFPALSHHSDSVELMSRDLPPLWETPTFSTNSDYVEKKNKNGKKKKGKKTKRKG